ncbi:rhoptry protein [Babesia ovis]|uniref:Rhoptry protein n=1 Tax=Babesia ovis TaxID=5869 RepID=A0A9W5TES8_BABOV|nr:rhoptry protein [Babesia ovis]
MDDDADMGADASSIAVNYHYEYPQMSINKRLIPQDGTEESLDRSFFISRDIFIRILSVIYFISFLGHYNQDIGLIGENGVWPAKEHFKEIPHNGGFTLLDIAVYLPNSDSYITVLPIVGMILSIVIACTHVAGTWMCLALWIIKLALITMRSGLPMHNTDLLLLEVGFLAGFLYSPFAFFGYQHKEWGVPATSRWAYYFLLYRGMFSAGVDRIRKGDGHSVAGRGRFKHLLQAIPLPSTVTHLVYDFLSGSSVVTAIISNTPLFVELIASVSLLIPIRNCRIFGGSAALLYTLFLGCVSEDGSYYMLLAATAILSFDDAFWSCIGCDFLNKLVKKDPTDSFEDEPAAGEGEGDVEKGEATAEQKPATIGTNILNLITYRSEKQWLKKVLFSRHLYGDGITDQQYNSWQRAIQLIMVCAISFFSINIMVKRSRVGIKAIVVFVLSLLLQVQSEVLETKGSYYRASGTFFGLHVWLILEMMVNGVHLWNFLLWVGITELQLGLCRNKKTLYNVSNLLLQSVVALIIIYYAVPVVLVSLRRQVSVAAMRAPFGIVNSYDRSEVIGERKPDVIIQGTSDDVVTMATKWKSYGLHTAPSDPNGMPSLTGGYVYEVDQLLRDVANKRMSEQTAVLPRFILSLLKALLLNKHAAVSLFANNPFPDAPPKYVRIIQYNYTYSESSDRAFFVRRKRTQIVPPLTLKHTETLTGVAIKEETKEPGKEKSEEVVDHAPTVKNDGGVPLGMADALSESAGSTVLAKA